MGNCGSCGGGGGGVTFTGLSSSSGAKSLAGSSAPKTWRVSYLEDGVQQSKDWATDTEAFAHAGAVGGTLSRVAPA